ncbi:MAG: twin-arginine translocase TatA/TatE family subunit [Actinomycetaceae bacterium]|nr:twin-arginine translocase TatA/TatE family subunit [Actinomycetaceae bacterium]
MGAMRPWHWIVVLLVIVVVFGASRLPNIAKNVGQSAKVLKKEMRELTEDDDPILRGDQTGTASDAHRDTSARAEGTDPHQPQ